MNLLAELPPTWIASLPEPLASALVWLLSPAVLGALAVSSVVLFALSAAGLPWFIARIPADYFSDAELREMGLERPRRVWWRAAVVALKNLLGLALLLAGVAMLVLPGQGLLTILAALLIMDFPGKRGLQRRLVQNDAVFRRLNALRRRVGAEPFVR